MPELSDKDEHARRRRLRLARVAANEPMAPPEPGAVPVADGLPDYTELHCLSNFSFQRGASHPWELAVRAWSLGYRGLAITDECSVAGVVRALSGLKEFIEDLDEKEQRDPTLPKTPRNPDFRLLYGSEFVFERFTLVALARDLEGWGQLCELITDARMATVKGRYHLPWKPTRLAALQRCELLVVPHRQPGAAIDSIAVCADVAGVAAVFSSNLWLAVELFNELDDDLWLAAMREVGARTGVPLVAAGDVHMHVRSRKPLQDVLTATRIGKPLAECGRALQPNAERHLRSRLRLAQTYPAGLLAETLRVAARCG
ncbi:MAG: error-prone DNA polymerase, partial [Proteobacteria bacterium]|nr:error-prone DNA polymerase [Pseudomonadota bacterium]